MDTNCPRFAGRNAAATAGASLSVEDRFATTEIDGLVCTGFKAGSAAGTVIFRNSRAQCGMLFEFSFAAGAAHGEILNCAAKSGQLMAFEMGKDDQGIGFDDFEANVDFV